MHGAEAVGEHDRPLVTATYPGGVIDHEGPVAPWRQIHAILMARITSGEYPPGGRLPSIVTMAQEFDVALTTARKALDVLKEDGLVVTSPMGTFVAKK